MFRCVSSMRAFQWRCRTRRFIYLSVLVGRRRRRLRKRSFCRPYFVVTFTTALERFSYIIRCVKKIYVRVRPNSRGTTGRFYIVTRIRETYYRARRDGSLVRVKDDKTEKIGFRPYRRARQDEFLGTRNDRRTVYVTNYYVVPRSRTLLRTRSAIRPCYVRSKCSKRSGRATKTHLQWVWDDGHAKTNTITALRNRRRRRKIIVDRDSRESVRGQ